MGATGYNRFTGDILWKLNALNAVMCGKVGSHVPKAAHVASLAKTLQLRKGGENELYKR
jgi:hypothetical protein